MARPKLITADTPLWLKLILYPYQFAASLGLAVVLITVMVITFALGTFIEAKWNTPVAQFVVYQTWWFNLMGALLAVNIFCAAAIRFPWKKHQTGFVVTHIGLLTLIFGLTLSRWHGIDAQLPVYEGTTENHAFNQDKQKIMLTIHNLDGDAAAHSHASLKAASTGEKEDEKSDHGDSTTIEIPFHPGPFNWDDYKYPVPNLFTIAGRHRAGNVLYDVDDVKLEVLDFYADSREVLAPEISIKISTPAPDVTTADGRTVKGKPMWVPTTLNVGRATDKITFPYGIPNRQRRGGGALIFSISSSEEQTRGFLNGGPEGETGEKGQVVLHLAGKTLRFNVDEKLEKGRFPLKGTRYEAEVVGFWNKATPRSSAGGRLTFEGSAVETRPVSPVVKVNLFKGGDKERTTQLTLFAVNPEYNVYDYDKQIYGEFWYEHRDLKFDELQKMGITSWIHIIQDADGGALHYRYWNRKKVVFSKELPINGSEEDAVDAFKMPAGELKLYVEELIPAEKPKSVAVPRKFEAQPRNRVKQAAGKFRLTVKDESKEFWLYTYMGDPDMEPTSPGLSRSVISSDNEKMVSMVMPLQSYDIGFRVRLDKFERKLDPGTNQASHFSSTVDFLDAEEDKQIFRAPLDGGAAADLGLGIPMPHDIACDTAEGRLYVTAGEKTSMSIQRIDLHSREIAPLIAFKELVRPRAIAAGGDRIFWVDTVQTPGSEISVVRIADSDGKPVKVPVTSNSSAMEALNRGFIHAAVAAIDGPAPAIAIDSKAKKLYWVDVARQSIGRCDFDGLNPEPEFIENAGAARGLAVNVKAGKIYWSIPRSGIIRSANLKDGKRNTLLLSRTDGVEPHHLTMAQDGFLYWTEIDTRAPGVDAITGKPGVREHGVVRVKPGDGAEPEMLTSSAVDNPAGLAVYQSANKPSASGVYWVQDAVFRRDVWITMNAPVEFSDPANGRWYRLFQEAFDGPKRPGDPEFELYVPADSPKEELYRSVLSVNYDPGRGIRTAGCFLVVLGIGLMFYMRAYFFKRPTKPKPNRQEKHREPITAEIVA